MKQNKDIIITIKKKDVRRSLNSCQNEHGQILCAFDNRLRYATAITRRSNHLSGAKLENFDELKNKINEKITKWKKTKNLNVKDFMLFVALELRLRASEKNNNKFSYYLTVYENKDGFTLRISDHHFNARTSEKTNDKYTTSVTFSNENPEVWDYFKTAPNVKAIEYVYYEDKVTKDDLISIAEDIIDFVETGKFTPSVKPNEINESPKPTGNNLSGGLYTNKTIDSIEERIKSDDSTVKDMSILDIISKYNCYITKYPKKGGVGYELTFLYYYEKDGKKYWERVSNFTITQNVYRTLKNIHKVQTNPVAEVLWQYWVKEFDRVKYSFYYDDAKYCYLVYNIMGYWQDKLLKFDKNHPHVLHKYTRKTTAEEYINDINTYDALIKHSALQKLELQLLEEEKGEVNINIKGINTKNFVKTYNSLKEKYPDTILLFRDEKKWYYTINEDAIKVMLATCWRTTPHVAAYKKNIYDPDDFLYFPYSEFDNTLKELQSAGYRVAIVEEKKGLKGIDNWNVTELNGINFDDNQKNPI